MENTGNWKPVNENKSVSLNPLPSKCIWDELQEDVFVGTLFNMRGEIEEFVVLRGNSSEDVNLASGHTKWNNHYGSGKYMEKKGFL